MEHRFGGPWTEEKLESIDKYLRAYMTIFESNERAALLETYYVDAFAGTGQRKSPAAPDRPEGSLFEDALEDAEARKLRDGSAFVALRQEQPFDHYVFVDRSEQHAHSLEQLRERFPQLSERIEVRVADANEFLADWCRTTDWRESERLSSSILTGCRSNGAPWRPLPRRKPSTCGSSFRSGKRSTGS